MQPLFVVAFKMVGAYRQYLGVLPTSKNETVSGIDVLAIRLLMCHYSKNANQEEKKDQQSNPCLLNDIGKTYGSLPNQASRDKPQQTISTERLSVDDYASFSEVMRQTVTVYTQKPQTIRRAAQKCQVATVLLATSISMHCL